MAFLIPAGLLIIGLLCCIGIAFLVVQARADERKPVAQKALVATQKTTTRSSTSTTTVIPATPIPSTPPASGKQTTSTTGDVKSEENIPSSNGNVDDASVKRSYNKALSDYTQEETTNLPISEASSEQKEPQSENSNGNGHSEHTELQNLQLYAEIEQIAQLFQDGKLSTEWVREQIQELSVKVQDMHQQSSLIERHIALLNQIALYMNELEQVRHEYRVLREKRGAVLRIPTHLRGEGEDGDTYIHTDKRPAMRKYTLKTM